MDLSMQARARALPNVLFKELHGDSVLLDLTTERYYGLDSVGTRVWSVLTSSESIGDAHRRLLEEFDVDPRRLQQDLEAFLAAVRSRGLVEVQHDSADACP